jgi:hypothetical protein
MILWTEYSDIELAYITLSSGWWWQENRYIQYNLDILPFLYILQAVHISVLFVRPYLLNFIILYSFYSASSKLFGMHKYILTLVHHWKRGKCQVHNFWYSYLKNVNLLNFCSTHTDMCELYSHWTTFVSHWCWRNYNTASETKYINFQNPWIKYFKYHGDVAMTDFNSGVTVLLTEKMQHLANWTTCNVPLQQSNAEPIKIKGNYISNTVNLCMYIKNMSHYILTGLLPWMKFLTNSPSVQWCLLLSKNSHTICKMQHIIKSMKNSDFT